MTSKKVYTTPELNSYGEFAQLTQQSGTGLFDFIGSVAVDGTVSGTTTSGANPSTSVVTVADAVFS